MSNVDVELGDSLAKVLPTGVKVTIRHISSAPSPCAALFAAPPGEEPESTFCENHFLAVSISPDGNEESEVIVFGIEVLVYGTAHLTTIFVSKADSTGYLHLLKNAPKVSLLRLISNAFLSFLVQTRQRPGVRLMVSLFARAQNQYLFPGSIENPEKHVLDDRRLIKWWCRVIDPILREYEPETGSHEKALHDQTKESAKSSATAFLIVPGCDKFETRGFFPITARSDDKDRPRWLNSYPLHQLCDNPNAPPRCLVPRFPDDPKTRFLIDLDDELPESTGAEGSKENSGHWRSVKSLAQFWEMMAFRQECSAGRLVGFLWLVINPPGLVNSVQMTSSRVASRDVENVVSKSAETTHDVTKQKDEVASASSSASAPSQPPTSDLQTSSITQPSASSSDTHATVQQATGPSAFFWPDSGRGHAVLSEEDYKAAINFLIDQDFDTKHKAIASTKAWAEKVASLADQLWVGQRVEGRNATTELSQKPTDAATVISTVFVRKRKTADAESDKPGEVRGAPGDSEAASATPVQPNQAPSVNVLNANLVRKKKKT
ncbi:histone acetyltransferase rtt109 [Aspergillus lentulus]|uniref:histone acetyltransferase n=1 Tax=Aspergillus lentulus TaxID=293939 RepID=A0AAN4PMH7_ASPLE|nr:histone acetyltransferase rtt109 [Aspergillus lentulus]